MMVKQKKKKLSALPSWSGVTAWSRHTQAAGSLGFSTPSKLCCPPVPLQRVKSSLLHRFSCQMQISQQLLQDTPLLRHSQTEQQPVWDLKGKVNEETS